MQMLDPEHLTAYIKEYIMYSIKGQARSNSVVSDEQIAQLHR